MIVPGLVPFQITEYLDGNNFTPRRISALDFEQQVTEFKEVLHNESATGLVALNLPRSARMVAAVFALVESRIPFAFLPPDVSPSAFNATFLLTDTELRPLKFRDHAEIPGTSGEVCYCIRTSGSTGVPKCVAVPHSSIWPNVVDFRDRFEISSEDTVLFSTSTLFDPSVIEMFLCMLTGASMVIVSDSVRSSPTRLAAAIRDLKPTFVQLTPAVFRLIDFHLPRVMDSVRILLLGGEKFPLEYVQRARRLHFPRTRIFDVYGITEVSCWATVFEVDEKRTEVFLGEPILDTTLEVDSNLQLLIGGNRRCWIDGVRSDLATATGDLVEILADGNLKIIGRIDDLVKINGIRCHLLSMGQKLCELEPRIDFARFLLWKETFLVLFVKSRIPVDSDHLGAVCPNLLRPSGIVYLDEVPVNRNGKIDTAELTKMLDLNSARREEEFWKILGRFGISKGRIDVSFVEHGVKSLEAAEIALILGDANAMQEILSASTTVADIVRKYLNSPAPFEAVSSDVIDSGTAVLHERTQPDVLWAVNTEKCIDGSPVVFRGGEEEFVLVASHSGVVACFNHTATKLRWRIKLDGVRFEASPALSADCAVIGAYDGNLYFILLEDGELRHQITLGEVVKAEAAVDSQKNVFVTSYNKKLWKITSTGSVCWEAEIAAGSPAVACLLEDEGIVIITTIKGSIEAFSMETGTILWSLYASAPIFSPVIRDGNDLRVTAVDGSLLSLDAIQGTQKKCLKLDEPIFASVFRLNDRFLISSQKGTIFEVHPRDLVVSRRIAFPGCSFVRSPFVLGEKLTAVSTDGRLLVMDFISLSNKKRLKAETYRLGAKEVFGQPRVTSDNRLIVGCRDDWLRCFDFSDINKRV